MTKQQRDFERLLRQSAIISDLLLTISWLIHGQYRRKHVGATWEELLVAFVLWREDTMQKPMTALAVAKVLGIPDSNASRCIKILIAKGIVCRVKRRYGRDVTFIQARLGLRSYRDLRMAIIDAADMLREIYGVPRVRPKKGRGNL